MSLRSIHHVLRTFVLIGCNTSLLYVLSQIGVRVCYTKSGRLRRNRPVWLVCFLENDSCGFRGQFPCQADQAYQSCPSSGDVFNLLSRTHILFISKHCGHHWPGQLLISLCVWWNCSRQVCDQILGFSPISHTESTACFAVGSISL